VLLHGLPASGDTFGAAYDRLATSAQLVVPDLLGFARSQDPSRTDFSLQAHLDALDAMLADLGLEDRRLVVGGALDGRCAGAALGGSACSAGRRRRDPVRSAVHQP
jgi:pimeloyl-ACP methyl ester carboxylesterase